MKRDVRYDFEKEVYNTYQHKAIDAEHISARQGDFAMGFDFWTLQSLVDLKPLKGSRYILSASEPYDVEAKIRFDKLLNWLNHFGIELVHAHSSGHMAGEKIIETVLDIEPHVLFPIHTGHSELFRQLVNEQNGKIKVAELPLVKGKTYEL